MFLVIVIIHNPDLLEEVLEAWGKVGVEGATVFHSTGMGRFYQKQALRDDLPLLPSLDDFYEGPQSETLSRTIMTAIKDEALIEKIHDATQNIVGDLSEPDTGLMIVTPLVKAYGLDKKRRTK
jgi:nitrogen regulatory protein PII